MPAAPKNDSTSLMQRRIRRILLVCNNYDRFALEEDGRLEARITSEYTELSLSNPPSFVRVQSTIEALELARRGEEFDLVLTMYNVGALDVFAFSKQMKEIHPQAPIILLTSFSREIYRKISEGDASCIDYAFCWNNSPELIIAIIKLLEDRLNADHDILEEGVQSILLVEDSVRYYSTYLPMLYRLVLEQNVESLRETLNESQQISRKRARPKILLATNYADAVDLYQRYKSNILGVISDIGFVLKKGDSPDMEKIDAGVDLCKMIKADNPTMPVLMQSSQESMRDTAREIGAGFVMKKSTMLLQELSEFIEREFGFGDFVVTDPSSGKVIGRANDLATLESLLGVIREEHLSRLLRKNYLSKWFFARGIFALGRKIEKWGDDDFSDFESHRTALLAAIHDYRIGQGQGVVAKFNPDTYNDTIRFARVGDGYLGGKARGLAFLDNMLQKHNLYNRWEDVRVMIPRTIVVTTEYFDRFIAQNGLKYVVNSNTTDAELLSEFVASTLPEDLTTALRAFVRTSSKPLAIRSSSVLEDSYYQPFAGVYSTYMIPHTTDEDQQIRLLAKAIKSVYASVYYDSSRAYITATGNVISEEKMAIIIQEVCGSEQKGYFFPTLSGVARSQNFYPIGHEKPEDGVVKVAYGLGKAVVDGDQVLRFSAKYPKHVLQTSTPELTMRDTQQSMFALNLLPEKFKTSIDDAVNLERIPVTECAGFPSFAKVVSTWDRENMRIVDSAYPQGPKYVTFSQILKYNTFPLAEIVRTIMDIAREEVNCNLEVEFAADLDFNEMSEFDVLQIRPISADSLSTEVDWDQIDCSNAILRSSNALGTGWVRDVDTICYIKPESFDVVSTVPMASEITSINASLREQGRSYVLVGYGRWGSSIPSLGVPVKWSDISEAKAIVECSLENFRVDPSQGTHFFQNLTSFNVGYVNVDEFAPGDDCFDVATLDSMPAELETDHFRLVRFPRNLEICIDGRSGKAVVK